MLKFITKILLFTLLSLGLYAEDGLSQKHLVSVSPEASATGVSADTTIEAVFDTAIVAKSVKKNTIKLKNVKGTTALVGDSTLRFTPNEALESGEYSVKVKKVKLENEPNNNTELKPKNGFQKFIYWFCSLFYDNPSECPLCKKICGNSSDSIKTKKISYTFTVDDASPKIETITLSETSIELHEGNETNVAVTAHYDDNTTMDISSDVEWSIADSTVASVSNGIVKALKEGITAIEAQYEGKTSEALTMTVYKEISGYRLPLEPDPSVNNSTLLGIDSNTNGVRDDVERKIIIKYQKPIEIELLMTYAKIDQEILGTSLANVLEFQKKGSRVIDCEMYLINFAIDIKNSVGDSENYTYNTKERAKKYIEYNKALSGGVYGGSPTDETAEACDFDVEQMLKDRK